MNKPVQKFLILISFFSVFLFLIFLQISFASNESDVGFDYIIEDGELFVDIVDELSGGSIVNPLVDFGEGFFSNDPITSTGKLGTSQESIRVFNYTHNPTWTLNIAGEHVESKWSSNDNEYPFNHPTDENLGRFSVNPELLSLSSDVGCSTENINFGSEDSFVQGSLDSIDIASAITTASPYCRFDLQDIDLSQIVPGSQPVGTYTLGMVLTISEGYFEAPSEPQELIVSFEEDRAILEWDAPEEEGSDPIDGYVIERTDSPWNILVDNTNSTDTSYVDTSIQHNDHQYRVSAINRAGVTTISDIPVFQVDYVSSSGGSVSTLRRSIRDGGFVPSPNFSPASNYIFQNFEIVEGGGNGTLDPITGEVTDLTGNMRVKANFEEEVTFSCGESLAYGGYSYATVQIGTQCWFAEDLRYCGPYSTTWNGFGCRDQCSGYGGKLYQWKAAMGGSTVEGAQGLCPDGWHVPTDYEIKIMEVHLGMSWAHANAICEHTNIRTSGSVGTKLSAGGSSGFNALRPGIRMDDGNFHSLGCNRYYTMWTSTTVGTSAYMRYLFTTNSGVARRLEPQTRGYVVRCLKD